MPQIQTMNNDLTIREKILLSLIKQEDIDVSVTQDMISIKGKRQRARELSEENYYYKELYWGSFSRSIMLPQEIDPDQIDATLKHGILTVRLPKVNKEKIQKIKIKSSTIVPRSLPSFCQVHIYLISPLYSAIL